MDANCREDLRMSLCEDSGHRSARRQPGRENADMWYPVIEGNGGHQVGKQRRLSAGSALIVRPEPVPAERCVLPARLGRVGDDQTVALRLRVHARTGCEILGSLRASVQHEDDALNACISFRRHVEVVVERAVRAAMAASLEEGPLWHIDYGRSLAYSNIEPRRPSRQLRYHLRKPQTRRGRFGLARRLDRGAVVGRRRRVGGVCKRRTYRTARREGITSARLLQRPAHCGREIVFHVSAFRCWPEPLGYAVRQCGTEFGRRLERAEDVDRTDGRQREFRRDVGSQPREAHDPDMQLFPGILHGLEVGAGDIPQAHVERPPFDQPSDLGGPVAVWCRSFDSVMCSKGDDSWAQEERTNFVKMRCELH
jgi:hypothetical protein